MQALLAGVCHGKIGRNEHEDAHGIPHRNGTGYHPEISASHIKTGRCPDARVGNHAVTARNADRTTACRSTMR